MSDKDEKEVEQEKWDDAFSDKPGTGKEDQESKQWIDAFK